MGALHGHIGIRREEQLLRMNSVMAHRGALEHGVIRAHSSIGQRLPAYKDYSHSFTRNNVEYLVGFDGDIFNKRELLETLADRGVGVKTTDDTELILELYCAYGTSFPHHIDGNFALAIVTDDSAYIARDSVGVRPLFYAHKPACFSFASEIKSVLQALAHTPSIDIDSLFRRFVLADHLFGDSTYISGIRTVLPGTYVLAQKGVEGIVLESAAYGESAWELPADADTLRQELIRIVERNVSYYASLPTTVGVLLSGGFDSSVLTALAVRVRPDLKTFTVSDDARFPDITAARTVAAHCKTSHHEIILSDDMALADLVLGIHAYEDLIFRDTIFKLSKHVGHSVGVAMSGVGADLLGMPVLARTKTRERTLRGAQKLSTAAAGVTGAREETLEYVTALVRDMAETPEAAYFEHFIREYLPHQLLPSTERALMYHGIEPAFPFADARVQRIGGLLSADQKYTVNEEKPFLRETFAYVDLPKEILHRDKVCSKSNLSDTKDRTRQLFQEMVPGQFIAEHPYRDLLRNEAYLIACYEIFRATFVDNRGMALSNPATVVPELFKLSFMQMVRESAARFQAMR